MARVHGTAWLAVLALAAGCSRSSPSGPDDARALESPAELTQVVAKHGSEGSAGGALCGKKVEVHRAWLFRGGSLFVPDPSFEVIAIDFTYRQLLGVRAILFDLQGTELRTAMQWVTLNEAGEPIDRYRQEYPSEPITRRVALLAGVPVSTRQVVLEIGGVCRNEVKIESEGPVWPPLPERELVRWQKVGGDSAFALVRARHVLPGEYHGLTLRRPVNDGGVLALQGDTVAVVPVDAKGEKVLATRGDEQFYLAKYWIRGWQEGPPTEYACGSTWCPLPAEKPWTLTDEVLAGFKEAERIADNEGREAQLAFEFGGPEGYRRWKSR